MGAAPPAQARPTILDVARLSGVSVSTASNALAGKRHVKAETRERVQRIAEEIGYAASAAARGMRLKRTWSIGLIVGDIANPFVPEVVRGIEDVIWRERNNLILCNTDSDLDKRRAYLRSLVGRQIDGLLIASQALDAGDMQLIARAGIPAVTLNRRPQVGALDYVGIDNRHGIRLAMDYLLALGHRRIAFIKGIVDSTSAGDRFGAYVQALEEAGLPSEPTLVAQGDYTLPSGAAAARQLMAQERPPTAIVAANDLTAIGALGTLHEMGVRVPDEVSVVGFDDIYLSDHPLVKLTTVQHPKRETGIAAASYLLQRIQDGVQDPPRTMVLKPALLVRGTSGRPPR